MEKKIIDVLRQSTKIVVTMHVHPDPDAMGAALAMALFLQTLGKDVRLYNEDKCPKWLAFMPRSRLCRQWTGRERFSADTVIILDCGDKERIGKVASLVGDKAHVINIDHHVTNRGFAQFNLVDIKASSTCEILYRLLKRAGCVITKDIAVLLYLGILTDTGSFGFDCTTSYTHEVVAQLLKHDIPVGDLYRKVYETMPSRELSAFFSTMSHLTLECDGKVACLVMTKKDVESFSGNFDIRDKVFGLLRAVNGLDVIAIFTESEQGRIRVNLRSRGRVDVARLAGKFNGGGHKKASGCYVDGSVPYAKNIILESIREAISHSTGKYI